MDPNDTILRSGYTKFKNRFTLVGILAHGAVRVFQFTSFTQPTWSTGYIALQYSARLRNRPSKKPHKFKIHIVTQPYVD